jgi:hypothetical protein
LERPGPAYVPGTFRGRTVYTEEQLYYGITRMVTHKRPAVKLAKPRRKERAEKEPVH